VAVHEIGHALGLEHSSKEHAVMNALYKEYNGDIQLDSDDIDGIKALYGEYFSYRLK
jgi:predicted Zn-dependent protease